MKLFFLILLTFFFPFSFVFATTVDSYPIGNVDEGDWNTMGNNTVCGQSFTGNGDNLTRADFFLKHNGSTMTGTAKAVLYAHTGTFGTSSVGTGSQLAESDTFDLASLTGSFTSHSFTFSGINQYNLVNTTYYMIGVLFNITGGTGSPRCSSDYTAPTHSGNNAILSGTWTAYSDGDRPFYVFGETPASPPIISSAGDMVEEILENTAFSLLFGLLFASFISIWVYLLSLISMSRNP